MLKLDTNKDIQHITRFVFTFGRFLGVGLSGVVVNLAFLWALIAVAFNPFLAAILATEGSIIWNFFLHNLWTFKSIKGRNSERSFVVSRFFRFQLVSTFGAILSLSLFLLFNSELHLYYLLAQLNAIGLTTLVNFFLNAWFTWDWFGQSPAEEANPERIN